MNGEIHKTELKSVQLLGKPHTRSGMRYCVSKKYKFSILSVKHDII
jgi:hypothetical protein